MDKPLSQSEWDQISAVYTQALTLPTEERDSFIKNACEKIPRIQTILLELIEGESQTDFSGGLEHIIKSSMNAWARETEIQEGAIVSHFRVLEKIGVGGMGHVYKAQDIHLDRIVALKFLPPHLKLDQELTRRFIQEAKTASALDHPNICTIYEIGEAEPGRHFIAMAYYEGQTVKDLEASRAFYENFGFEIFGGDASQNWLILKNGDHVIGLFQGMFEKNMLTFNPGWDQDTNSLDSFTDVRELQRTLKSKGVRDGAISFSRFTSGISSNLIDRYFAYSCG